MRVNNNLIKVKINNKRTEVPSDWKIRKISDYFKIKNGTLISKNDMKEKGKYPVYSATVEDKIVGYVDETKNVLRKDIDIILPSRGGAIGIPKIPFVDSTSTQTTLILTSITKSKAVSNYVRSYLLAHKKSLFRDTKGGAILQINIKDIKNIDIPFPPNEEIMDGITNILNKQEEMIKLRKEVVEIEEKKLKYLEQTILKGKILC